MSNSTIFHESWYRISSQKVSLRSSVRVSKQEYRGMVWYVLHDPFSNKFYRITKQAFSFVSLLNFQKTIGEVLGAFVEARGDESLTQGDIVDLLSQLYNANLLHYEEVENSLSLFKRYKSKKKQLYKSTLMNIMFLKIPLWDPNDVLKRLTPLIHAVFSYFGAFVWVILLGIAIKYGIENHLELQNNTNGIIAPHNIFLLYIAIAIVKIFHEFGHSFAVRRFGGEVHTMGIMFLLLTPLPYMDATASWSFRNRWQRALVGASGMIFELFIASVAMIIWTNIGDCLGRSILFNVMIVASVSTLLFNINPLLRFDGYYILSDIIDTPNLHQQAAAQVKYVTERYIYGKQDVEGVAETTKESVLLVLFGLLSNIYKVVIFSGILRFISKTFLVLALFMGASLVITWGVMPLIKFVKYIFYSGDLARVRKRAVITTGIFFSLLALILFVIPFPQNFKSPGIIESEEYATITSESSGYVDSIYVRNNELINKGDTILTMHSVELDYQIDENKALLEGLKIELRKALNETPADLKPIRQKIGVYTEQLEYLEQEKKNLVLCAPISGQWTELDGDRLVDRFLVKGTQIGDIVGDEEYRFTAVVSQNNISNLFSDSIVNIQVKIAGSADSTLDISEYRVIPMEKSMLPSASLGWLGGGSIMTDVSEKSGRKSIEPFYEVRALLEKKDLGNLKHGKRGSSIFRLTPLPLSKQAVKRLQQLIQKHYKI